MNTLNRRKFLRIGGTAMAAGLIYPKTFLPEIASGEKTTVIIPMIHATDLYHLNDDPDDHNDLACVYALAYTGQTDLKGLVIDYPRKLSNGKEPDVMGVAQMNYITGLVIAAVVGSPFNMKNRNDIQLDATKIEHQGINWVINILRTSPSPVIINIVGSATDIAVAPKKNLPCLKRNAKEYI